MVFHSNLIWRVDAMEYCGIGMNTGRRQVNCADEFLLKLRCRCSIENT